jgi:hypothetical protein
MAKKKPPVADEEPIETESTETEGLTASAALNPPKRIAITIQGLPPGLLMSSKGGMVPEEQRGKQTKINTPEDQAHNAAYWRPDKTLGLPWISLYKCIVAASKRYKFKGREAMNKIVAATIACAEDLIPLGTAEYKIDSRWGRIPPKTGGVVMLHRALLPEWEASFEMLVDDEFYPADKLKEVLVTAGKLVGVCANSPRLEGPYGKFLVTGFEVLD